TSPATSSRGPPRTPQGSPAWTTSRTTAETSTRTTTRTRTTAKRTRTTPNRRTTMTDEIAQLLRALRLGKIAEILDEELARAEKEGLSLQELIALLLRAQWHNKQESVLKYRITQAKMPEQWTIESFPFKRQPGVAQRQIRGFAELDFVPRAEN